MEVKYPKEGDLRHRPNEMATIDYSNMRDGYVIVWVNDLNPIQKFQVNVAANGKQQNFSAHPMHDEIYIPLVYGSGTYTITILRKISSDPADTKYRQVSELIQYVELVDEYTTWLHPTAYSEFFPDSACVKYADKICRGCLTDFEKMETILHGVMDHLEYDRELANTVNDDKTKFWIPDPEDVYRLGKSICWGYASLIAAMARSQGIPTKIAVGYAGQVYHAWNMVYLQTGGELTPGYPIPPNNWTLIDATFADTAKSIQAVYDFLYDKELGYKADYFG